TVASTQNRARRDGPRSHDPGLGEREFVFVDGSFQRGKAALEDFSEPEGCIDRTPTLNSAGTNGKPGREFVIPYLLESQRPLLLRHRFNGLTWRGGNSSWRTSALPVRRVGSRRPQFDKTTTCD